MAHDYNLDWLIGNYMKFFEQFGMDEENIRGHFEEWKAKSKNNSVKDYLWYIFQVLLGENAKQLRNEQDFYQNNFNIYMKMWEFRIKVENKKDNGLVQLIQEARLRKDLASLPYKFHVKLNSGHCCPYCDALNQQLFTPEDVLKNQYLGSCNCTREWGCNCRYTSIPIRDENGSLLMISKDAK